MLNQERNLKRASLAKGKKGTHKKTNKQTSKQTNNQQKQQQQQAKTERKQQHIIIVNNNSKGDKTKIYVDNKHVMTVPQGTSH